MNDVLCNLPLEYISSTPSPSLSLLFHRFSSVSPIGIFLTQCVYMCVCRWQCVAGLLRFTSTCITISANKQITALNGIKVTSIWARQCWLVSTESISWVRKQAGTGPGPVLECACVCECRGKRPLSAVTEPHHSYLWPTVWHVQHSASSQ